jgi:single-strand DNA-binding protein
MNNVSFVGNLTSDPRIVFPESGTARATFSVAVNEGQGDDEKTHFINVTAFGTLAENIDDSLKKGNRVVVVGRFNTYPKEVEIEGEGKTLTMLSITASAVGPDLRWATAAVTKVASKGKGDNEAGSGRESDSRSKPSSANKSRAAASSDSDDF